MDHNISEIHVILSRSERTMKLSLHKKKFGFVIAFLAIGSVSSFAQVEKSIQVAFGQKLTDAYVYAWNDPTLGLEKAEQLQNEAKKLGYDAGYCHSLLLEADCYISRGDYASAIEILFEARNVAAIVDADTMYQRVNRPFGKLYILLGDKERAVAHQKEALQQSNSEEETAIVTHALAEAYLIAGELDSAVLFAKPLFQAAGHFWSAPVVLLGDIYVEQGRFDEALEVFKTSSGISYLLDKPDNYVGRARAFYGLGMIDSCRFYAQKALDISLDKGFYRYVNEASDILAQTYEGLDPEKYIQFLQLNVSAKDSLFGFDKLNKVNNLILEDEARRSRLAAAELRIESQQRTMVLLGLASLLLVAGLLLWRNNRIKSNSNKRLAKEKKRVEEALEKLKEAEIQNEKLKEKELSRLKEIDDVKSKFYTNITHEFRTPLTVIMGMNENISGHELERKLIKRNANNLLQLINQLLDLSKFDSGFVQVVQRKGDIISYIHYLTESFYSMASDKRIQLSFHPDPAHLIMDFDEQKIKHIIYNLLSNALKFTRAGGKVTVSTSISSKGSEKHFLIAIKDSGIGIQKDEIPFIFDRFYQAKNATSSGTGIGLALTKEIVKLMDGEIKVKSEEGWGTEFVVSIPALDKALTPLIENNLRASNIRKNLIVAVDLPVRPDQFSNEKQSVLIVEDSPGVVTYIKSIINDQFNVIVAVNGQEGIELALEHIPDIIISDVMMPEMNGFDLTKMLKLDSRTSHIPIIMLTAKSDLKSKIQGLETGSDAYLSKPFEKEELLVRLKKLIELRRNLQEKYKSKHITLDEKVVEPDQEDEFLIRVREVILEHIATMDLNVSQISAQLFISHTQFYRKIKALTGLTPTLFIRKVRLKKSTEMLSKSTDTIAEIAYSTGFSDPNYFSRVFKKEYNKAPGEWRESAER